jgi:hypothetical protein
MLSTVNVAGDESDGVINLLMPHFQEEGTAPSVGLHA